MNGTLEPANRRLMPVSITAPSRVATRMAKTITAITSIGIYKLRGGTTDEYISLTRRRGAMEEMVQRDFGLPGDSGSFLINRQGRVCGLYYANSTNWVGPDGVEVWHCNGGLAMSIPEACREIEWKTAKWTAKGIQLGCLLSSVPDIKGLCFALWLVLLSAIVNHGPWSVF